MHFKMSSAKSLNLDQSKILSSRYGLKMEKKNIFMDCECFTLLFTTQYGHVMTLKKKAFENIEGIGENGGKHHFLLSPCHPT